LLLKNREVLRGIELLAIILPPMNCRYKVAVAQELLSANVNQLRQILPLHLLALFVKVEPGVQQILIVQISVEL